jgi:hypothetical protein
LLLSPCLHEVPVSHTSVCVHLWARGSVSSHVADTPLTFSPVQDLPFLLFPVLGSHWPSIRPPCFTPLLYNLTFPNSAYLHSDDVHSIFFWNAGANLEYYVTML